MSFISFCLSSGDLRVVLGIRLQKEFSEAVHKEGVVVEKAGHTGLNFVKEL